MWMLRIALPSARYLLSSAVDPLAISDGRDAGSFRSSVDKSIKHVTVCDHDDISAKWPANNGIWHWDNEILVCFTAAQFTRNASRPSAGSDRPDEIWQARSMDGGEHWAIERPEGLNDNESDEGAPPELSEPLNFGDPGFAMLYKFRDKHIGPSRFYISVDRCRSWSGPFRLKIDGIERIATRTDYIVRGPHECIMFGSAAKSDGLEGRAFSAGTSDGGRTWQLLGLIGPEPEGYMIMPSTVRMDPTGYLTALRHKNHDRPCSIDLYFGDENASHWKYFGQAAADIGAGNPPNLLRLTYRRLALVYGYRATPYGIRVRISENNGRSWENEIVLRSDGLKPELGYSKSIVRPDGNVVSVYYFTHAADERSTIEASIWKP
jgi:hypothetical protein